MAVVKTPQTSKLSIKVSTGVDGNGKAIVKTLSYGNVKSSATDQLLFDVGVAIAGMQSGTIVGFARVDNADLANA